MRIHEISTLLASMALNRCSDSDARAKDLGIHFEGWVETEWNFIMRKALAVPDSTYTYWVVTEAGWNYIRGEDHANG